MINFLSIYFNAEEIIWERLKIRRRNVTRKSERGSPKLCAVMKLGFNCEIQSKYHKSAKKERVKKFAVCTFARVWNSLVQKVLLFNELSSLLLQLLPRIANNFAALQVILTPSSSKDTQFLTLCSFKSRLLEKKSTSLRLSQGEENAIFKNPHTISCQMMKLMFAFSQSVLSFFPGKLRSGSCFCRWKTPINSCFSAQKTRRLFMCLHVRSMQNFFLLPEDEIRGPFQVARNLLSPVWAGEKTYKSAGLPHKQQRKQAQKQQQHSDAINQRNRRKINVQRVNWRLLKGSESRLATLKGNVAAGRS